jgi:hypothetical protein
VVTPYLIAVGYSFIANGLFALIALFYHGQLWPAKLMPLYELVSPGWRLVLSGFVAVGMLYCLFAAYRTQPVAAAMAEGVCVAFYILFLAHVAGGVKITPGMVMAALLIALGRLAILWGIVRLWRGGGRWCRGGSGRCR